MFKNNSVTLDTNWQHLGRCQLCKTASSTHEVDLGLRASWVLDMGTHATNFEDQLNKQNLEDAEYHGAVADLEEKRDVLYEAILSARWMIKTIIDDPTLTKGDRRMIEDVFDISQPVESRGYDLIIEIANDILTGQQKLVDMAAVWKLPDGVITNLTNAKTALETANETAKIEHGEKLNATETLNTMRAAGNNLLRNIYRWAIAVWGDDDSRLLEFGFVPKSMIWTENTPYAPKNFHFDESDATFKWDAIEDVTAYQLDYRLTNTSGDWTELYKGSDNFCADKPPAAGEYDFRVRAWDNNDSGRWSTVITVDFP